MRSTFCLFFLLIAFAAASAQNSSDAQPTPQPTAQAAANPSPTPAQDIPVIDAALGPCMVTFTVTDGTGKPVYDAHVKVHIAYGTFGVKKLDLNAGTNVDGKVRFIGIPTKVHNPPLYFQASKGSALGLASFNPEEGCQATHEIALTK